MRRKKRIDTELKATSYSDVSGSSHFKVIMNRQVVYLKCKFLDEFPEGSHVILKMLALNSHLKYQGSRTSC